MVAKNQVIWYFPQLVREISLWRTRGVYEQLFVSLFPDIGIFEYWALCPKEKWYGLDPIPARRRKRIGPTTDPDHPGHCYRPRPVGVNVSQDHRNPCETGSEKPGPTASDYRLSGSRRQKAPRTGAPG